MLRSVQGSATTVGDPAAIARLAFTVTGDGILLKIALPVSPAMETLVLAIARACAWRGGAGLRAEGKERTGS